MCGVVLCNKKRRCALSQLTISLSVAAALLHGIAFILYNIQTKLGQSKPNATTWGLWAFSATINAFSYSSMSGDMIVALQFFTSSVACILTFLYVLVIGKLSWPKRKEWALVGLVLFAVFVWWKWSATSANVIILVAVTFSFIPTFEGVWRDPFKETPLSWTLWTLAYLVTATNVLLRGNHLVALVSPIGLLIAHGSIAVLSTQKRKKRFSQEGAP